VRASGRSAAGTTETLRRAPLAQRILGGPAVVRA